MDSILKFIYAEEDEEEGKGEEEVGRENKGNRLEKGMMTFG